MLELILMIFLPLILIPQIAAGFLARQNGRNFWFWFAISFFIPIVSLVILVFLKDKKSSSNHP